MDAPTILISFFLMLAASVLLSSIAYLQERREGYSHEQSLTASLLLIGLLVGTSIFDYVAVVAKYA